MTIKETSDELLWQLLAQLPAGEWLMTHDRTNVIQVREVSGALSALAEIRTAYLEKCKEEGKHLARESMLLAEVARQQNRAEQAEFDLAEVRSVLSAADHTGKEWRTCERCSEVRSKAIARYESVLNSIAHGEGGDTQAHDWPEFWESVKRRAREALEP